MRHDLFPIYPVFFSFFLELFAVYDLKLFIRNSMTGTILKLGNEELNDDELNEEELRDCLKAFDSEGNGSVPVAELRKALAKWTQLENAEVDDVIDGIIEPNGRLMNIESQSEKMGVSCEIFRKIGRVSVNLSHFCRSRRQVGPEAVERR